MNIIKVDCLPLSIFVGYERENDARGVTFDYSAWAEQYGDGVLQLLVQRPGDADPYPVVLTAGENNTAVWFLSATDTAVKGQLEIQLIFTVGSVVAKTAVLPVLVDRSLAAGATPPDPYETWLETLTQLAEQILHTTQPPEIRDGYWYIFDPDTGEYVNSGVKAEGEDGVGITGAQLNADYTLTLNFSDGTSYTTPSIRGAQGAPGPTPQLSIGTVTTGSAGSSAAVEISGTPEAPVLNFTIPRGDTGEVSEAELQAALLDKADVITDTASGAIASFPDGMAASIKSLMVAVEPVQDLNGYDAPWPAGGGKNLLDPAKRTESSRNIYYYFTDGIVLKAGTYTLSVSGENAAGLYIHKKADGSTVAVKYNNTVLTFTLAEDLSVYVDVYYVTAPSDMSAVKCQLESGSTATAWTPHSNICPIYGHTDADVVRTRKNLLPTQTVTKAGNTYYVGADANTYFFLKAGTYTISNEGSAAYMYWRKKGTSDNNVIHNNTANSGSFTLTEDCEIRFWFYAIVDVSFTNIMLNIGNTASAYAPYSGVTIPISWQSEAGTIYGGFATVDNDGHAEVQVTMGYDQMTYSYLSSLSNAYIGTENVAMWGGAIGVWVRNWNYQEMAPRRSGGIDALCNAFEISANNSTIMSSQYRIYFKSPSVADFLSAVQELEAIGSGLYLCYELATPITFNISDISPVLSNYGWNNFWSDAGDVSVEYRADTKLYIEKKITAAIAAALNS